MHKRTNPILVVILALVVFGVPSCTEAFSEKMESADHYLKEVGADNVVVGTAAEANNGEKMVMTTLTFSGLEDPAEEIDLELKANKLAWDYYTSLASEYFKGETHIKITFVTKSNVEYEYIFPLEDLYKVSQYQKVADEMVQACIDQDTAKIKELKDDDFLPDDQMGVIYEVNAYNDSVYGDQKIEQKSLGFRFANGKEDKNLKLFSVNYDCGTKDIQTLYTVNVDRTTKKVVYVWLKTDPR